MLRRMFNLPGTPDPAPGATPAQPAPAGGADGSAAGTAAAGSTAATTTASAETATVREIVAQLDAIPRDRARFLAGFAYVISRAAQADLSISEAETREMERIVVEHGHVPEAQAVIVVQIAKTRSDLFGATEDYLVTREFKNIATVDERLDLFRCCFIVSAIDDTITAEESGTLMAIAEELDIEDSVVRSIRSEYAEKFAALQEMRRRTAAANPTGA